MLVSSGSYRLEGNDLKRWWQVSEFFSFKPKWQKKADKFRNTAIQHQLTFFLTLPFGLGLYAYIASTTTSPTPVDWNVVWAMLAINGFLIAILFGYFLHTLKMHRFRVVQVDVTDVGLNVESPWFKQSIRWDQVRDAYVNQDGDYVLDTSDADEFVFSNELTNSKELFEIIAARAPKNSEKFSYNYRYSNECEDAASIACLAVIIAFLSNMFRPWASTEAGLQAVALSVVGILVAVTWWRFHLSRVARLVRIGSSSCMIKSRRESKEFSWDQITSVKQLGSLFAVKTGSDWFVVLSDKKEPIAAKLVELKTSKKLIVG